MPSVGKLRRTWFALLRELDIADEDRHDVQESHTGKPSLADWTPEDYDQAIAALQRSTGAHRDHHAHVREDRPACRPEAADRDGQTTESQARYIGDLCSRIEWRKGSDLGPLLYVNRTILRGEAKALRRARLRMLHNDGTRGPDLWMHLTRQEGSDAIKALEQAARSYPREEREHD